MSRMTERKWRSMSEEDRLEYLNSHEVEIESKRFLDGSKKVGDYTAVIKKYRARIGGVLMSSYKLTKAEARKSAESILKTMNKAQDYDNHT